MNFFINMSALSAQKRFLGEFGSGSRLYVDVVHAIQKGHKAVQVLLSGGWPVDCASEYLASFDATDSNCCEDWGGFMGDRAAVWIVPAPAHGKVGGTVTAERPGWSPGDGGRRPPRQTLLDSDRQCSGCLRSTARHAQTAYTRTAHTVFPLNPMGAQLRPARSGTVDTPPFEVGAGFRAGFEEKVC